MMSAPVIKLAIKLAWAGEIGGDYRDVGPTTYRRCSATTR